MKAAELFLVSVVAFTALGVCKGLKCYTCDECSKEHVLHHFLVDYKGDAAYCLKYNKTMLRGGKETHVVYRRPVFNESVKGLNLDRKCVTIGPGMETTPVALAVTGCYCQFDGCNAGPVLHNGGVITTAVQWSSALFGMTMSFIHSYLIKN